MNNVNLIGRLTRDAELKFTPGSGNAVCNFTVALDDGFGDKKKTYFFPVVCWSKIAENVASFTHKGSLVGISGKLTQRSYDNKEGKKVQVIEVLANEVKFLDSKKDNSVPNNDTFSGGFDEDLQKVDDGSDMPF